MKRSFSIAMWMLVVSVSLARGKDARNEAAVFVDLEDGEDVDLVYGLSIGFPF